MSTDPNKDSAIVMRTELPWVRPGLGFKRFRTAWRTLVGYETLAMMRKGQVKGIGRDDIVAQAAFVNSLFDVPA